MTEEKSRPETKAPTPPVSSRQMERLVGKFDRYVKRSGGGLDDRYGEETAAVMRGEMLDEYRRLIPDVPYIGGWRNGHSSRCGRSWRRAIATLLSRLASLQSSLRRRPSSRCSAPSPRTKRPSEISSRVSAIFASNDPMAMGVLSAAHEMGFDVPGELSVAGFDDSPLARHASPPLTTVHQPIVELARLATGVLLQRLQGHTEGELNHCLQAGLVRRASTAPPGSKWCAT